MAKHTDIRLRSYTFYQVFPRQYSALGTFKAVEQDLNRIANMGVDVLYFLPIHPIGEKARKGLEGSPYSIKDYYAICEKLGTFKDFKSLISKAHDLKMKVMIDIVFNHTSRDSLLVEKHPDWFYKNDKGEFANRIGDWSDITDLDFSHREVWDYLIDVLIYWAKMVDGFRCDVAPLLPIDFWVEARQKVDKVNPNMIWLTESVEYGFIKYLRDMGYDCSSDSQMYEAFDMCYDYDIYHAMNTYLKDGSKLSIWLDEIERQEVIYPKNYVKLRSFENHDQERLRSKVRDHHHFMNMNALMFFLKGSAFIYNGQEHEIDHRPNLFEKDVIPWNQEDSLEHMFKKFATIKKNPIFTYGNFNIHHKKDVAIMSFTHHHEFALGIFNLEKAVSCEIPLKDGTYMNELTQKTITIKHGTIELPYCPIVILTTKDMIK